MTFRRTERASRFSRHALLVLLGAVIFLSACSGDEYFFPGTLGSA